MTPARNPTPIPHFPFGIDFQMALLKLLTLDTGFAAAAMPHIEARYFENEVLAWAYTYIGDYREAYNAIPPISVISAEANKLDSTIREVYQATLARTAEADLGAEDWLRDQTIDFLKRNIFVAAFLDSRDLYNSGEVQQAYDTMMARCDKLYNTAWTPPDREFLFDQLGQRVTRRMSTDPGAEAIVTGIHELDHLLGGGLSKGELGIWIAFPKRGKTTLLVNHGAQAVARGNHRVLHAVFEGSRHLVAARYDTIFAQAEYSKVKTGNIDQATFSRMQYDYALYSNKLILRGFTDHWSYSAADIFDEIKELKRIYNWVPDAVIVDYVDLLRGRGEGFRSEFDHQQAACRDLKSLANRGFAVWTATQAQRPTKDIETDAKVLTSRNVADCYAKVRVADFIGSLNQTAEERKKHQMRLYAELYRDAEAGKTILVHADFGKMSIRTLRGQGDPSTVNQAIPLGYTTQTAMGY